MYSGFLKNIQGLRYDNMNGALSAKRSTCFVVYEIVASLTHGFRARLVEMVPKDGRKMVVLNHGWRWRGAFSPDLHAVVHPKL